MDQLAGLLAEGLTQSQLSQVNVAHAELLSPLSLTAGAGRYARSLRLMLRKARRRRVVPPSSAPPSMPGSPTSRSTPSFIPPYPDQPNFNNNTGFPLPPPSSSLASTSTNFNDVQALGFDPAAGIEIGVTESSPSSSLLGFDWGYAQDLLGSVGMTVDEG